MPTVTLPGSSPTTMVGTWSRSRISGGAQRRPAPDLDIAESEVRRMLNTGHNTRAAATDRALRQLRKRIAVTVGEAAGPARS